MPGRRWEELLSNLIQVRLRATGAPEGHAAKGTVRCEPAEAHPGEAVEVVVDVTFEGGAPRTLAASCSPAEDLTASEPRVELGPEAATVTIPLTVAEGAELGRYYAQVVYADERREHFESEAPLEVTRHWVTIESVTVSPPRASPGDAVDVAVRMSFGGEGRVRGHARGRLQPEGWGGDEAQLMDLSKERSSVMTERQVEWHVRIPREAPLGPYMARVEFASGEGREERTFTGVLRVVPRRAMRAEPPAVEPAMLAPGEAFVLRARLENVGFEPLDVTAAAELAPEAGGSAVALDERPLHLPPAAVQEVAWEATAPERAGRWLCRVRARAERTEGADPVPAVLDVRPPNMPQALSVVPSSAWAGPGEAVELVARVVDAGSHPGSEATVTLALESDAGARHTAAWTGGIGTAPVEARARIALPHDAAQGAGEGATVRYAALALAADGRLLIRVPGAVAVRRRIALAPAVLKTAPDPGRVADCLVPGERVVASLPAGGLTIHELSSGCRLYSRGDAVVGVDAPMDDAFWGDALDAELRAYSNIQLRLRSDAAAFRAEAMLVRAMGELLGRAGTPSPSTQAAAAMLRAFDPARRDPAQAPKEGPLGRLASALLDHGTPPSAVRECLTALGEEMTATEGAARRHGRASEGAAAAGVAARALDAVADLLGRDPARLDERGLEAVIALLAASGSAGADLHMAREGVDLWADVDEPRVAARRTAEVTADLLSRCAVALVSHRARRRGVTANMATRAAHAAVARDLRVEAQTATAYSGQASALALGLVNGSGRELRLRLHIALPSPAWALLEPPARGSAGLASVGPVAIPAGGRARLELVVYVPTTARLDGYTIPIEVLPEPVDLAPERGGELP